ncbi:MAG: polysaccharide deacetylase family protein [Muribaculaceae bacterium]|nr:polysaccharide deacetylase family protein [Muribaculaceae bacterium]
MRKLTFIAMLAAILGACTAKVADKAPESVPVHDVFDRTGTMVRHDTLRPVIWLIFSADSTFEGGPAALDALDERGLKANFFFTGNFLRDSVNSPIIHRVVDGGHYVSGHSNGHILYADWSDRKVLVDPDSTLKDMRANMAELRRYGVNTDSVTWLVPPYEWIAEEQVKTLADSMGIIAINPTPGIQTFRDYTTPQDKAYRDSEWLLNQLYEFEREHTLNGAFLIIHLGTDSARHDKFHRYLPSIIDSLTTLGYSFERLP